MAVEKAFVLGVRAIEATLGIFCDNTLALGILSDSIALPAFQAAIPIIAKLSKQYNIGPANSFDWSGLVDSSGALTPGHISQFLNAGRQRKCLSTQ